MTDTSPYNGGWIRLTTHHGFAWFQVSRICAVMAASEFDPSDTYIYTNEQYITVTESPEEVMNLIQMATI